MYWRSFRCFVCTGGANGVKRKKCETKWEKSKRIWVVFNEWQPRRVDSGYSCQCRGCLWGRCVHV